MQVRSENKYDQSGNQFKMSSNNKSGGKESHPRKRASLIDLTNNNIKRTRKEAKKNVPAKKLNERVRFLVIDMAHEKCKYYIICCNQQHLMWDLYAPIDAWKYTRYSSST